MPGWLVSAVRRSSGLGEVQSRWFVWQQCLCVEEAVRLAVESRGLGAWMMLGRDEPVP